ncbi:hypothetical protein TWF694_009533 [Orbilia ellipsospora]|uniref:F-box domain-containing protein n=1 Tax=Orbilia ellipsospora TaxID=2528407 RepID=A0AAV9XB44_9PEZI
MESNQSLRYLLLIPRELQDGILSQLRVSDLSSFSLCSKGCYEIAIPFLFRSVSFSKRLLNAFRDGGRLSHAREHVKHVSLYNFYSQMVPFVVDPDSEDFDSETLEIAISRCRYFASNISLFPNIKSLDIGFSLTRPHGSFVLGTGHVINLPNMVFRSILTKISNYSFFRTLKQFTVETGSMKPVYYIPEYVLDLLSPENQAFLRLHLKPRQIAHTLAIFPWNLEEAKIHFEDHEYNSTKGPLFNWCPILGGDLEDTFYLTQGSVTTLKHLNISCRYPRNKYYNFALPRDVPSSPLSKFRIYANVTKLHLTLGECHPRIFEEIARVFPNVVDLTVAQIPLVATYLLSGTWSRDKSVVYTAIPKMKNLRSAQLPWPILVSEADLGMSVPRNRSTHAGAIQLRDSVGVWIVQGLVDLEEVVFTKWSYDRGLEKFVRNTIIFTAGKDVRPQVGVEMKSNMFVNLEGLWNENGMESRKRQLDEEDVRDLQCEDDLSY